MKAEIPMTRGFFLPVLLAAWGAVLAPLLLAGCASDRPIMEVREEARDFEGMGLASYRQGDFGQAIDSFERALEHNQRVGSFAGIASNLLNIARCYLHYGLYDNAERLADEAVEIYREAELPGGVADGYALLATIRTRQNRYDQAMELLEQSLELYDRAGDRSGRASALNSMGSIHLKRGEYGPAAELIDRAIGIYKKEKNHGGLAGAYNNKGYLLQLQGDREVMEWYLLALEEDRYIENSLGISSDLHNIAGLHKENGDYDRALFYYKRALEVNRQLELVQRIESDLHNVIDMLRVLGRDEEARAYLQALEELQAPSS
jgi:tetratricopeptide (TPR) repeat protein